MNSIDFLEAELTMVIAHCKALANEIIESEAEQEQRELAEQDRELLRVENERLREENQRLTDELAEFVEADLPQPGRPS